MIKLCFLSPSAQSVSNKTHTMHSFSDILHPLHFNLTFSLKIKCIGICFLTYVHRECTTFSTWQHSWLWCWEKAKRFQSHKNTEAASFSSLLWTVTGSSIYSLLGCSECAPISSPTVSCLHVIGSNITASLQGDRTSFLHKPHKIYVPLEAKGKYKALKSISPATFIVRYFNRYYESM